MFDTKSVFKVGLYSILGILAFVLLMGSWYTVDEGNVGIVKRFGEVTEATGPGLHFKAPFIESVHEVDVRTRKYPLVMPVATTSKNEGGKEVELQAPSTVTVSVNWNIPVGSVLDIYRQFGSLDQYENKILNPVIQRTTKGIFSRYSIEYTVYNRNAIEKDIWDGISVGLKDSYATVSAVNVEEIDFPPSIKSAIQNKQTAKLNKEAEEYVLEKQELVARQAVNTANAERDAAKSRADGEAYATEVTAEAKAKAIKAEGLAKAAAIAAQAKALADNKELVEYTKALARQNWNGQSPTTVTIMGQAGENVDYYFPVK